MPMLHHTGLTVTDLGASLKFWRDALGMQVVLEQEKAGGYLEQITREPGAHVRMVHLAFDGAGPRIELFQYLEPAGGRYVARPADTGFVHVCVACDDLEERFHRLVAAGGVPFTGPVEIESGANRGGRALYLRDPDGHVVELFQRPPS